jgi:hypothetical protein
VRLTHLATTSQPPRVPRGPDAMRDADMRLRGRWLLLARSGWIVLVPLILGLDVLGTLASFHQLQIPCTGSGCAVHRLTPAQLREMLASGVSLGFFATYQVTLSSIGCLVYAAVAAVSSGGRP